MIFRVTYLIALLGFSQFVCAEVAPEITTVEEGYNVIAKIPCLECPFLYQDTSDGEDRAWAQRQDNNALLLNVSLPYDSAFLSINGAQMLAGSSILPKVFANQVVQDLSKADLNTAIESNQLVASHETNSGAGYFGLSYRSSIRNLKESRNLAVVFHFDIFEIWTDLPERPITFSMENPEQKILELVMVQKPLLSAQEPSSVFEIIRAELVPRDHNAGVTQTKQNVMHFQDWDSFGRKGTLTHLLSSLADAFVQYVSSGVWALMMFVLAVMALFVIVCLFCIFGTSFWQDEYGRAQHRKRRNSTRRRMGSGDVEMGKGRFKSAEELGLTGRGKVIGVGKSD